LENSDADRKIILKWDLKTGWEFANWTNLVQGRDKWQAYVFPAVRALFVNYAERCVNPRSGLDAMQKVPFRESHTGHPAHISQLDEHWTAVLQRQLLPTRK
jgi:hypothetical protein